MLEAHRVADAINTLAAFCGPRDVDELTRRALTAQGWDRADAVILFGGSILSGADEMATAIRSEIATTTMIVGGQGHTTEALRDHAAAVLAMPGLATMSEAEIFQHYLRERHAVEAALLETTSTNCGTNITAALGLLDQHELPRDRVVLIQDATMQRRMDAGLRRARPTARIMNFASYVARVEAVDDQVRFREAPADVWPLTRYASMLLGEIERLRDDTSGYGPRGKDWIAHVDVPEDVEEAYRVLSAPGAYAARRADPRWASS